ncbi:MAG: GspH/FimT family pseudopilin [Desulfobacterales bacterium]|uniref:Type II secretion system protein H n=1 Tax=Candidatus Desulfatibia vada TaxID=2841696 RepID=A0A8J6TKK8_9BACT|nr:GspH/FimT family pseudopilin [Candidatus Desulfatibia vada]
MRNSKGFTLIELIIAMVIMGIMAAIGIPNFLGWVANYNLKAAANELYGNMQFARINAVKQNKEWAVVFDTVNGIYYVCSDDGDGDWATTGNNTKEKTVTLSDYASDIVYGMGNATANVTATGGAFPGGAVFGSRGTLSVDEGYIYLTNGKGTAYAIGSGVGGAVVYRQWLAGAWG